MAEPAGADFPAGHDRVFSNGGVDKFPLWLDAPCAIEREFSRLVPAHSNPPQQASLLFSSPTPWGRPGGGVLTEAPLPNPPHPMGRGLFLPHTVGEATFLLPHTVGEPTFLLPHTVGEAGRGRAYRSPPPPTPWANDSPVTRFYLNLIFPVPVVTGLANFIIR
jgi:hypothetical protein